MMVSLKLLGGASLEVEGGPVGGPAAQGHRIALLALIACSPSRSLTRGKLMALLWPERDTEHGRKLLNQSVYELRKALGQNAILSVGKELRLAKGVVQCDVVAFENALAAGQLERSVELYTGPFLDGFFLSGTGEFERWANGERTRLADAYGEALEELAETAASRGENRAAVEWWKARAAHDPYDSRVTLHLMEALEVAGNLAGALQHAQNHGDRLREDLGLEPPPEIAALAERLRRAPAEKVGQRGQERNPATSDASHPVPAPTASKSAAPARPRSSGSPPARPWLRAALGYAFTGLALAAVILATNRLGSGSPDRLDPPAEGTAIPVDEIARAVAQEVDRRLSGDTTVRLPEHRTQSIAAYELYLRGNDPALLRSARGARQGLEYFRRAIALDSTYAAAWAGLARMSIRAASDGDTGESPDVVQAFAEGAALRAVALDDSLGEAHATLGLVHMGAFDFARAEAHLKRAINLRPRYARFREWLVTVYLWTGRLEEALAEAERALELDPLSPSANAEVARVLIVHGRCDEALDLLERLAALEPPLLRVAVMAAQCHARSERWADAIGVLRTQVDSGADPGSPALLAHMLVRAGQREEALRIRANLVERWRNQDAGAFLVAIVDAGLGDLDEAFIWLDRAVEDRSLMGWPHHFTKMDILRERIGDDPRFAGLRERIGLRRSR